MHSPLTTWAGLFGNFVQDFGNSLKESFGFVIKMTHLDTFSLVPEMLFVFVSEKQPVVWEQNLESDKNVEQLVHLAMKLARKSHFWRHIKHKMTTIYTRAASCLGSHFQSPESKDLRTASFDCIFITSVYWLSVCVENLRENKFIAPLIEIQWENNSCTLIAYATTEASGWISDSVHWIWSFREDAKVLAGLF